MQISFWSNMHGQAATSATTAAIAATIAQRTAYKTLVAHNHSSRSALEGYFFKRSGLAEQNTGLSNQGIDALVRLMRNGRLKPDMVADYTHSLLRNHRLDILMGTSKKEELSKEDENAFMSILQCSREFYDVIVLDVNSGLSDANSQNILESSDILVFCLNQNCFLIEDFMVFYKTFPFLKEKRSAFVITRYEKHASMTLHNLARRYELDRSALFEIPNNSRFSDALNSGRVFDFVAYSQGARDGEDKTFITSLNRLCDYIVEGCTKRCQSF